MGKSVNYDRRCKAAMRHALALAGFLIAMPGASFAKGSGFDGLLNNKPKKVAKSENSSEAASVDKITPEKPKKNDTTIDNASTRNDAKKNDAKKNVNEIAVVKTSNTTAKPVPPVAKIFSKPFYTKVGLSGYEIEKVSQNQMAMELGLNSFDQVKPNMDTTSKAPWQKVGAPYKINGMWYIPAAQSDYDETGTASWYGTKFHGQKTANGEIFDMNEISIAHPTLPIPCLVEVTNLENGQSIIARVNDRGPFADNRLIDVSMKAAELLGFKNKGTAKVRVKYVGVAGPDSDFKVNGQGKSQDLPDVIKSQKLVNGPDKDEKPVMVANTYQDSTSKSKTQIGAFTDLKLAKKFAAQQNANTSIVEAIVGDKTFYRVFIDNSVSVTVKAKKSIDHNSILASL